MHRVACADRGRLSAAARGQGARRLGPAGAAGGAPRRGGRGERALHRGMDSGKEVFLVERTR